MVLREARRDLALAGRIWAVRAGSFALALRGDPIARLMHHPWRRDPYAVYATVREQGRVVPSRVGISAVATHELCESVLRDRRFGVRTTDGRLPFVPDQEPDPSEGGTSTPSDGESAGPIPDGGSLMQPIDLSLLMLDPPDHTRLRRLAQPAFAARRLQAFRPIAEKVTGELLDDAAARGRFDLVADLASPLPITVIARLLAIPDVDLARFARWGRTLGSALDGTHSAAHARRLAETNADARALFADLVARRRADPGEDVVSGFVAALDAGTMTLDELLGLTVLLLVAGFETTTNLVGNAVRALQATPDQWEALVADPGRAGAAVEETLRYDPPVQLTSRVAHEEVEIGGRTMRRNWGLMVMLAGAGRDPAAHPDPDRFHLDREQRTAHLAFSGGGHYCLGAPLARLEGEVALRLLAERMPGLRPVGRIVPRRTTVLRGPARYPVTA